MKKVIFISDLHLGDKRFKETPFLDFLNSYVTEHCSHLVIAGDFFELIQQETEQVLKMGHKVIAKLWQLAEKIKITYIIGNHDLYLSTLLFQWQNIQLAYPSLLLQYGPYKIHVEHGHLQQEEYKKFPKLYTDLAKLGGFLNLFDPSLQNTISEGLNALDKIKHNFSLAEKDKDLKHLDDFAQSALKIINSGVDYVVFGHTHEPQQVALGKGIYFNSGDWVAHSTFVEFNPSTGEMQLKHWL